MIGEDLDLRIVLHSTAVAFAADGWWLNQGRPPPRQGVALWWTCSVLSSRWLAGLSRPSAPPRQGQLLTLLGLLTHIP